MEERGHIKIHLQELIEKSGLSKNKFCHLAQLQRTQLNMYLKSTVTRLDTEVLIRICDTLNCSIGELIEYIPPNNKQ